MKVGIVLMVVAWCSAALAAQSYHLRRPNQYRQTADDNAVTVLQARLGRGELELPMAGPSGRLRALLAALAIPESSQTLVFSKTSLQRHRIAPDSPRALYFGPDAYVGWVPGAAALEVAVGDPRLGMAFYTLAQGGAAPVRFVRDDSCLSCHATSHTHDEPGVVLRSVFVDAGGDPIASAGEVDVSVRTPMAERWGGWYVTGRVGVAHRGNGIAVRDERGGWQVAARTAADLREFAGEFRVADYLVPTSDVGALLALEQQAMVHNLLVRAMLQTRFLLENDRAMQAMLGEEGLREATLDLLDDLAAEVVAALLLAGEATVPEQSLAVAPRFAAEFAAQWPQAVDGVRVGELVGAPRTFALPLSPMVHAPAFARLPDELRHLVLRRLRRALQLGRTPRGVAIDAGQREALDRHLRATLPGYGE